MKTKIYYREIKKCSVCPHYNQYEQLEAQGFCTQNGVVNPMDEFSIPKTLEIHKEGVFPEWCPLADAPSTNTLYLY